MKDALREPVLPKKIDLRGEALDFFRRRRALLTALFAVVVLVALGRARDGASEGTFEASVARAVERAHGLTVDAETLVALEDDGGVFRPIPVVFRARAGSLPHDLYYAEARPGRDGAVLDVAWVSNLTHTSSADELAPKRLGPFLLYASHVGDAFEAVSVLDMRGEPSQVTATWPLRARIQNAITNLEETGTRHGVGRRRYRLLEPATSLETNVEGDRFVAIADARRIILDPERAEPVRGAELVEHAPMVKGMPGTITWVVDTVRNLSFVGPEPIEWLEHAVFGVKDSLERAWHGIVGDDHGAAAVAEEMGVGGMSAEERRRRLELSVTDPEIGWPPARLEPPLGEGVEGEGEWIAVVDDPFVQSYPGAPPAFYQTFLRADPERTYTRVYATMWDPRQVQLHIVSGTREPESATGETGTGMAPRDPETMSRLVAGFNGGFQALHGEFGMMADERVYLPPKPWAATVAVYDDGRVAMGSWPGPPEGVRVYQEGWAVEQIPDGVVALRQNLTSVVEDGTYNPWGRWWWGAAPVNADEQTYIDRSGLCVTREGFMAYFWGESMGPEGLGAAMNAARCVRGMHLDMNSRHTGFEFFHVRRSSEPAPPIGHTLDEEYEYEGPMQLVSGYTLRARKMVRRMSQMGFPRYSGRDGRDFFYLTLRPTLPGPDIARAEGEPEEAGAFSTSGLPHAGYPYAFARAYLGAAEDAHTWLVRVDGLRVRFGGGADEAPRVLAYLTDGLALSRIEATSGLYATRARGGPTFGVGALPEGATLLLAGAPLTSAPDAGAAIGVDSDGFIFYAERQPGEREPLARRLARANVRDAIALPDGVRLAFDIGGTFVAPDAYEREVDLETALPLVADERAYADVLFPDTEPLPYHRWWRLQDARVRYVREGEPTFVREGGGLRRQDAGAANPE